MGIAKSTAKTAGALAVADVMVKSATAVVAVLVAVKAIKALTKGDTN